MEVRTIQPRKTKPVNAQPRRKAADLSVEILSGKQKAPAVIAVPSAPIRIEATPRPETQRKLRVASYCRVSTGSQNQVTSIINQREHYEAYIKSNPDWEFAGVYWEADVSGTKASNRPELQRLISDCKAGRVNLILTKSISRFARNITDCLEMVRMLTSLGVNIRFEKENINTGTMESEFLLTLYSSFAEEESKSISLNETWAKQKQFENGTFRFSFAPFGFNLVDGGFEVNEEQASIVKEIFDSVLSGKGTSMIARELNARQIPTGTKRNDGSPGVWTSSMVGGIIKNVVYIGDVLHQKTYFDDFRFKYNYGERQQYYNEGHHAAIVDSETFEAANAALRQRGAEKGNVPKDRHLRNNPHHNRYAFSSKLICGCCGGKMKRVTQKTTQGNRFHWSCAVHLEDKDKCAMKRELEENIRSAFRTMMNKLFFAKDLILDTYEDGLREEESKENKEAIRELKEKLKTVEDEKHRLSLLLRKGCGEPVSFYQKAMELEARESSLRMEINALQGDSDTVRMIGELREAVRSWNQDADPDAFFTVVCDGAEVMSGEYVEFHLKCGLRLRESLKVKN